MITLYLLYIIAMLATLMSIGFFIGAGLHGIRVNRITKNSNAVMVGLVLSGVLVAVFAVVRLFIFLPSWLIYVERASILIIFTIFFILGWMENADQVPVSAE